jgi:hypothetical protein
VVGTHCSKNANWCCYWIMGTCHLLCSLNLSHKEIQMGFVLCAVGGRRTCCFLCITNSLLREAQTSALPRRYGNCTILCMI